MQNEQEAISALQPFTNASMALRDGFEVAEAVKLLEVTLEYAYIKEQVRYLPNGKLILLHFKAYFNFSI